MNTSSELSGKTPAAINWMLVVGLIVMLTSRFSAFQHLSWMLYAGSGLIVLAYIIRMYYDWKRGDQRALRNRLIWLLALIVIAVVATVFAGKE